MLQNIESQYKKNLKEVKFNKFYWSSAIILVIISFFFQKFLESKTYIVFIILGMLIIIYFINDYKKTMQSVVKKKGFKANMCAYVEEIEKQDLNNLINILKLYNFKTKNDLKLAIDYFNSQKPIKIESDFLGWIVSSMLTLASFIVIFYDNKNQSIDYSKLSIVFGSTLGIIISLMIVFAITKLFFQIVFFSKTKIQSFLADQLTYIYINFDKFKNQLTKN